MTKTFHFLGGVPRSGATLFAKIMNQNPKVFVSKQTRLFNDISHLLESKRITPEINNEGYTNIINLMPDALYSHKTQSIIIDKNHAWGTTSAYAIQNQISPNGKTLVFFRPILEILASFVNLCNKNPNNFLDKEIGNVQSKFLVDARCEWLMAPNSDIQKGIEAVIEARKSSNINKSMIIVYDDLVYNTPMVFDNIYYFLQLEECTHQIENIEDTTNSERDNNLFGIPELHNIHKNIIKSKINVYHLLPPHIISKYKDIC